MWVPYLIGGLMTMAVLFVVFPLMIMRGITALAEILGRSEVEDEQS